MASIETDVMKTLLLLLPVLGMGIAARAESPDSIPNPRRRVGRSIHSSIYDGARVLNDAQKHRIDNVINALEKKTGAQMMVVTVRTLDEMPIEEWSRRVFNRIGIGRKGKNDGALWVFAMRDRKSRLEVGSGLRNRLTDARASALLDDPIRPAFRRGDYGGGILAGVQSASNTIEGITRTSPLVSPRPMGRSASSAGANGSELPSGSSFPAGNGGSVNTFPANSYPISSLPSSSGFPGVLVLIGVLVMGGIGSAVYLVSRPRKCPRCQTAMQESEAPEGELSEANQCELSLGSRSFVLLSCPQCGFSEIDSRAVSFSGYAQCEACQNWTAQKSSRVVQGATYSHSGLEEITQTCQFPPCGHVSRRERTLSRLQSSSSASAIGSGIGSSLSSSDSSSSSSSGSYDGGSSSDSGGGSSDGGGASGSW